LPKRKVRKFYFIEGPKGLYIGQTSRELNQRHQVFYLLGLPPKLVMKISCTIQEALWWEDSIRWAFKNAGYIVVNRSNRLTPEKRRKLRAGSSRAMRHWWSLRTPEERSAHGLRARLAQLGRL